MEVVEEAEADLQGPLKKSYRLLGTARSTKKLPATNEQYPYQITITTQVGIGLSGSRVVQQIFAMQLCIASCRGFVLVSVFASNQLLRG